MKAASLISQCRCMIGQHGRLVRFRSDKPAFQSPEYPWATEPPVITKTTAAEAAAGKPVTTVPIVEAEAAAKAKEQSYSLFSHLFSSSSSSSSSTTTADGEIDEDAITKYNTSKAGKRSLSSFSDYVKKALGLYNDPFDDSNTLSEEYKDALRRRQKATLPTTVVSEPITQQAPAYMAKATHPDPTRKPETIITTLDNGLRVVSLDLPGTPVASLGMVSQLASRSEWHLGSTNLLEILAFGATEQYPMGVGEVVQAWGSGAPMAVTGREQSLHCLEVWQPHLEDAVSILGELATSPYIRQADIDHGRQVLSYQTDPSHVAIELFLSEALHEAAFGKDQQLGKRHFCLDPNVLQDLTPEILLDHWYQHITDNPKGVVLGCAGTKHDDFVKMVERHFGHLEQETDLSIVESVYKGGECQILVPKSTIDPNSETGREKGLTRVAVAWPMGGWHADDFVTACVLQSLLGGGSSFSAGGPGKGMYSRLYRTVLNRYPWAESAEATTAFYNDAGLLGMQGSCPPKHAREMVKLFCQHMQWLANKPVLQEELLRAKNMLRCNVLIQLESRLVMFEDITRQLLTYGRHEPMSVTAERIEAVTVTDLQNLAGRLLRHPPAVASAGVDLSDVPNHEEVCSWLK